MNFAVSFQSNTSNTKRKMVPCQIVSISMTEGVVLPLFILPIQVME